LPELRFDGRVAIVTGAGNGLGREHALLLAARGARVVVNDIGASVSGDGADARPAQALVEEIAALGGEAVADHHSVATAEGGRAIVEAALDSYGRLDIVVNNAGILRNKPFEETTPEQLDPLIDVHLRGAFNVTRPAWIHMQSQKYGRIVNTTSASGAFGTPGQSNYGSVKAGLIGFTRVLAAEGEAHNIKANAIAPSGFTRMITHSVQNSQSAQVTDDLVEALRSSLDPAQVSPVVAFLAHEVCSVTGEVYSAGAGQVARIFLGRTRGYSQSSLSIEDVRDHLSEIRDETGYLVPANSLEEMALFFQVASG
jgi:NAD(P)-dependent dehydrogenase (short-subunit alcohol dehydrogenase family)